MRQVAQPSAVCKPVRYSYSVFPYFTRCHEYLRVTFIWLCVVGATGLWATGHGLLQAFYVYTTSELCMILGLVTGDS